MRKNTYINQMTDLLNDQTTYKKLNKDPIKHITTKIMIWFSWFDSEIIDERIFKKIT